MFPTYHGHQKWQYGSHPQSPRPPKGIELILRQCFIEWDDYQGQKRVRTTRKGKRRMQLSWNKTYPHHSKRQYEAETPDRCQYKTTTTFSIECYIDLCPWKGEKSVRWSRNGKRKTGKTTKNSPLPLHVIPTKQILLPNTLSTSNIRQRKASNNQFRGRASIYPSKARWRRGRSKGRKWTDFSDFFRRSSRGTTKKPLPTHPNSSNA